MGCKTLIDQSTSLVYISLFGVVLMFKLLQLCSLKCSKASVYCGDNRLCQTSTLLQWCSITDLHAVPYRLKQAHNAIFCFRLYVYFVYIAKVRVSDIDCGISELLAIAVHWRDVQFLIECILLQHGTLWLVPHCTVMGVMGHAGFNVLNCCFGEC